MYESLKEYGLGTADRGIAGCSIAGAQQIRPGSGWGTLAARWGVLGSRWGAFGPRGEALERRLGAPTR